MPIDRDGDGPPLRKAEAKPDDGTTLRATPFTEDVFDDEYYRGRGRMSGGSPLGLIVGVAVGAAVAGGAAWFALKDRAVNGLPTTDGGVPVIKAEPSPYKIKPENPGGLQVANQDKTVYDRVAKSNAPNRVENLLPPPEQPKAPPKAEHNAAPRQPAVARSPLEERRDELAEMIAKLEKKEPPPGSENAPAQPPVPGDAVVAPQQAAVPGADEPRKDVPVPPSPPAPMSPASPGTVLVQLAAAKSEESALAEWNRVKSKHGELLAKLSPTVVRADLGERGVFYRLRAGTLPDRTAAEALCAALTAQGEACLVVKP